jgi:hypothetical protein
MTTLGDVDIADDLNADTACDLLELIDICEIRFCHDLLLPSRELNLILIGTQLRRVTLGIVPELCKKTTAPHNVLLLKGRSRFLEKEIVASLQRSRLDGT